MEPSEYPNFVSEELLPPITKLQRVRVFVEGNPLLSLIAVFWFIGVCGTLILSHLDGTARLVALAISASFFFPSGVMFYVLLKKGILEKPQYYAERFFLWRMGVQKPMKFLREHPLHLAAYNELDNDLQERRLGQRTRDGINMVYLPAMLVFTGHERCTSGPLIVSIMEDRKITDAESIAAILDAVEDNPPVLNEGAL